MLLILISIVAIIFTLQNSAVVSVSFLFKNFEISLALVIMLAFALGFLVSLLAIMPYFSKLYFKSKQYVRTMTEKDGQIGELKHQIDKLTMSKIINNDVDNNDTNVENNEEVVDDK